MNQKHWPCPCERCCLWTFPQGSCSLDSPPLICKPCCSAVSTLFSVAITYPSSCRFTGRFFFLLREETVLFFYFTDFRNDPPFELFGFCQIGEGGNFRKELSHTCERTAIPSVPLTVLSWQSRWFIWRSWFPRCRIRPWEILKRAWD